MSSSGCRGTICPFGNRTNVIGTATLPTIATVDVFNGAIDNRAFLTRDGIKDPRPDRMHQAARGVGEAGEPSSRRGLRRALLAPLAHPIEQS